MREFSLVEVKPFNGMVYKLALPSRDRDAHEENLVQTGGISHVQEILFGLCPRGSLLVDVGANVGSVAIPLAIRGARVIAYDPLPENAEAIKMGAQANGVASSVEVRRRAVWHENSILQMFAAGTLGAIANGGPVSTEAVRLDEDLAGIDSINAIKIDVEGAELSVLRGAEALLRRDHPHVVFEIFPEGLATFGVAAVEVFEFLERLGYKIYRVTWPVLSLGYRPPAEQLVVDYLATVLPPEKLSELTRFDVRPLSDREIVDQIKAQSLFQDRHRMYVVSIADMLPLRVQNDAEVSDRLADWRARYGNDPEVALLRRATLGSDN